MRKPTSLSQDDAHKQKATIKKLRKILKKNQKIRFSDEVEIRGCVIDPYSKGKAIFLVEEVGVPLFLREAALTTHPGVTKALGSMFDLKWRFDSE
jgi:hypothetical protein